MLLPGLIISPSVLKITELISQACERVCAIFESAVIAATTLDIVPCFQSYCIFFLLKPVTGLT